MQQKSTIILYDFLNDDSDFKDAAKDFEVGQMVSQTEQQKKKGI